MSTPANRPKLLDLFCGPGGAGVGYHRAGFDVTGVDNKPQPDYPYDFIHGDALEYLAEHGHEYNAIHASPPCTEHTVLTRSRKRRVDTGSGHLLSDTLAAVADLGHGLWVVENVMGAVMPTDLVLCGSMFGLRTYRHRRFTIGPGVPMLSIPDHPKHRVASSWGQPTMPRAAAWEAGWNITCIGNDARAGRQDWVIMKQAMGVEWIAGDGVNLVIPPAYTQHVGGLLLDHAKDAG